MDGFLENRKTGDESQSDVRSVAGLSGIVSGVQVNAAVVCELFLVMCLATASVCNQQEHKRAKGIRDNGHNKVTITMNEPRRRKRSNKTDIPFHIAYFLVLAFQVPVYLLGGLAWALLMITLDGKQPLGALLGGLVWGFSMWILLGNMFAIGLAWRREAKFPMPNRDEFRSALESACRKLRLKVLTETADEVVLGPKWALFRFRFQESRLEFTNRIAVLTSPALFFRTNQESVVASAGSGSSGQRKAEC
jgi:hypothetical protein